MLAPLHEKALGEQTTAGRRDFMRIEPVSALSLSLVGLQIFGCRHS
jgi:hypothetical protein